MDSLSIGGAWPSRAERRSFAAALPGIVCLGVALSAFARPAPVLPSSVRPGSGGTGGGATVVSGELDALERDLAARHPKTRRSAVRSLAALGTLEAWRLVARALDDPDSEVADEAQLAVAAAVEPRFVAEFFGPLGLDAKSERVRERAAEAFGRMAGPLDARTLARSFAPRDGRATRFALWSFERLALRAAISGERGALVSTVESLARSAGDGAVRADALAALAALDPARARRALDSAFAARDPRVRAAALAIDARAPDEASLARFARAARDPSAGVRALTIDALESLATRAHVARIVEILATEERPRLAERAMLALQRLSGLKHRRDPRPWRDWCAGLPEDWRPPPVEPERATAARRKPRAPDADAQATTSTANFGGLSILSDRLSFLVDFSGSMWTPRDDGRSVKSVVDARLALGLDALEPSARFNLWPYANEPLAWERGLVDAKPANRRRALEFFVGCRIQGRGDLHGAVVAALGDDEVDTLMIWSDGVPTGGAHSNLELVVPLLVFENRFRGVAFDLILVDAPRRSVERFAELARSSGGRLLSVSLDDLAGVSARGG